jgi:hypothetical protein
VTMAAIDVLDFEGTVAQRYANLRSYLQAQGILIGPSDMLIAARPPALSAAINDLLAINPNAGIRTETTTMG